jgi:hypothetical protein
MDVVPPDDMLLIERGGALDVVMLDGAACCAATVRCLLASHEATSAALLVAAPGIPTGSTAMVLRILGETIGGGTDERRYRVHPRSRRRPLVPLTDAEALDVKRLFRPLFAVHVSPLTPAEVPGSVVIEATSRAATVERIVAA